MWRQYNGLVDGRVALVKRMENCGEAGKGVGLSGAGVETVHAGHRRRCAGADDQTLRLATIAGHSVVTQFNKRKRESESRELAGGKGKEASANTQVYSGPDVKRRKQCPEELHRWDWYRRAVADRQIEGRITSAENLIASQNAWLEEPDKEHYVKQSALIVNAKHLPRDPARP